MKSNTNVLIIIGVIFLICGKLQGSELEQFEQWLRGSYAPSDWRKSIIATINKKKQHDLSVVAAHEEEEDIFFKEEEAEEISEGLARVSRVETEQIRDLFEPVVTLIASELAKSPNKYAEVSFSKIPAAIDQIKQAIESKQIEGEQDQITETDLEVLKDQEHVLHKMFADALFTNLMKLAGPIIKQVNGINDYIEQLRESGTDLVFDERKIEGPIADEINPRLDSAYQKGFLGSKDIVTNKATGLIWRSASRTVQIITDQVKKLTGNLMRYVEQLNTISKTNEEEKSVDNFNKTAQAIRTMKWVIDNLYTKLEDIFFTSAKLIPDLTSKIADKNRILSDLKYELYSIYKVTQKPFNQISIVYYAVPPKVAEPGFFRTDSKDDLLIEISPSVYEIVFRKRGEDEANKQKRDLDEEEKWAKMVREIIEYPPVPFY